MSRSEFVRSLPRLEALQKGSDKFSAADAEELFNDLDKDRSGWINYKELDKELRRDARHVHTPEVRALAKKLLKRTDVVLVLGAPTRAKKAFCSRLAYTFQGTWLSMRTLADMQPSN